MTTRREFLYRLAALGLVASPMARAASTPRFAANPFALGVASGYPSPHGVVLWTRLIGDESTANRLLDQDAISVRWEVARDEAMRDIVASGRSRAEREWAHSVHVQIDGLDPDRWYWYRFMAGDAVSVIGRTRTSPAFDAAPSMLRFAFASCQQYEQGYFGAHRRIAADAPDLVAFLGDYIYESSWGRNHVRKHDGGEPYTLDEYRARYALYKSDPDLQAAHAACPWVVTWDDHEVDNDYAADRAEDGMDRTEFLLRRAAAYRAYYEHMPLPARMRPRGSAMRIHTRIGWGTLARFFVLDDRQYRSYQSCTRRGLRGGSNTVDIERCERLANPERTMLGAAQERWLERALAGSRSRWNVIAQQTRMAQLDQKPGPGRRAWTDAWDGYPAARARLLDQLARPGIANPVVIGGDVHAFHVCDLKRNFDDPASETVATEFVSTSVTSQGWAQAQLEAFLPDNPHIKLIDSRWRGYVRVEVTPARWRSELRAMEHVVQPNAPCSTLATYVVEDGRPGAQRDG